MSTKTFQQWFYQNLIFHFLLSFDLLIIYSKNYYYYLRTNQQGVIGKNYLRFNKMPMASKKEYTDRS